MKTHKHIFIVAITLALLVGCADRHIITQQENLIARILKNMLQSHNIQATEISPAIKPADYLSRLLEIEENVPISATRNTEGLTFSLMINKDNSPMTQTNEFSIGKHRIYACFPNKGIFAGLSKVVSCWRKIGESKVLSFKTRTLDSKAAYNHTWVASNDGWREGVYIVELFRVDTLEKIAQGTYTVIDNSKGAQVAELKKLKELKELQIKLMDKSIPIETILPRIEEGIQSLPRDFLEEQVKEIGLDLSVILTETGLSEYAIRLLRIARGETMTATDVVGISFTTKINPDNSPVSSTVTFPVGKHKIYVCFPNERGFENQSKVFVRWINKTTDKYMILRTYKFDPNSRYNFIWIDPKEGWESGTYEVELFRIDTLDKVAGDTYTVK